LKSAFFTDDALLVLALLIAVRTLAQRRA